MKNVFSTVAADICALQTHVSISNLTKSAAVLKRGIPLYEV